MLPTVVAIDIFDGFLGVFLETDLRVLRTFFGGVLFCSSLSYSSPSYSSLSYSLLSYSSLSYSSLSYSSLLHSSLSHSLPLCFPLFGVLRATVTVDVSAAALVVFFGASLCIL